jgi:hypothetical protein
LIVAHSLRTDRVELRGAIEDLRDAIADRDVDAGPTTDEALAAHRAGNPAAAATDEPT